MYIYIYIYNLSIDGCIDVLVVTEFFLLPLMGWFLSISKWWEIRGTEWELPSGKLAVCY